MSAVATVLRRDRLIVATGLAFVAVAAWLYMIYEAHRMNITGVCECVRMKMGGPELSDWSPATLPPLFLMWSEMMVAMMLPSAMPMILTFAAVARNRQRQQRPYVPVAVFVSGYIAIWCAFSVTAALSQWLLHRHALLSTSMTSTSAILGGILLLAAGAFQFTPLKHSCLTHCRGPIEFIMTRWRDGWRGAFAMGLEHGAFCTGCCWALMILLFVAGVMNLVWIAALTILVCLEKVLPYRNLVSVGMGVLLTGWGACLLVLHFLELRA